MVFGSISLISLETWVGSGGKPADSAPHEITQCVEYYGVPVDSACAQPPVEQAQVARIRADGVLRPADRTQPVQELLDLPDR